MATASAPVDLVSAFRGLAESRASDAFLVVTVRATGDFIQFTAAAGAVQLDFPLITPRQRQLQRKLEEACAELGLTRTVNSGTDGSRFLDYDIDGAPEEIAETVRALLRRVFAVNSELELSLTANGFSLNGA
jgi:hypothetical protein